MWISNDDDASSVVDDPLPTISTTVGEPVACSHRTTLPVPYSHRRTLVFYASCDLRLVGGTGDNRVIVRSPEVADDFFVVLVRDDDDITGFRGIVRLRVDDFSLEDDGQVWVHGVRLYTRAQLDAEISVLLPDSFDDAGGELVESVNQIAFPVECVIGFGRVLSTSHRERITDDNALPTDG